MDFHNIKLFIFPWLHDIGAWFGFTFFLVAQYRGMIWQLFSGKCNYQVLFPIFWLFILSPDDAELCFEEVRASGPEKYPRGATGGSCLHCLQDWKQRSGGIWVQWHSQLHRPSWHPHACHPLQGEHSWHRGEAVCLSGVCMCLLTKFYCPISFIWNFFLNLLLFKLASHS